MQNLDKLVSYLQGNAEVTEISLEYVNGDKDKIDLTEINDLMTAVDWDSVDEVEVELADGTKLEFGEVKEEEDEEESDEEESDEEGSDEEDDEEESEDDDDDEEA